MSDLDPKGRREGHETLALTVALLPSIVLAALPILVQATVCFDEPDQPLVCSSGGLAVALVWWVLSWVTLTVTLVWAAFAVRRSRSTGESPWRAARRPFLVLAAAGIVSVVLFVVLR